MTIQITSSAFADGEAIPQKYTGEGADVSPPLSWSNLPEGTLSLALICNDPDAPRAEPWVHWLLYNLPAETSELPEGLPRAENLKDLSALQGQNSWSNDNLGYRGPMPPPGHGVHHYHFRLYALDTPLELPGAVTEKQLVGAIKGHILASGELVGTYERPQ